MQASVVTAYGLSQCGPWAGLPRAMWDLPGPRIEPVSPALAEKGLLQGPSRRHWLTPEKPLVP